MFETYWIALGRRRGGTYAQSIIDLPQWKDSAMKDSSVVALVEIKVDLDSAEVHAALIKNTSASERTPPPNS